MDLPARDDLAPLAERVLQLLRLATEFGPLRQFILAHPVFFGFPGRQARILYI
jgi:hypothetical protein